MAAFRDEGFEVTPAEIDPAADELELDDDLAGGGDAVIAPVAPPPLGRAPAYDFVERRFVPGRAGGPLEVRGLATLKLWVEKCLRTRQGENPAVDPGFGVTILPEDLLDGGVLDDSAIAEAYEEWERAILRHPRILSVETLTIDAAPDSDVVLFSTRIAPEGLGDELLAIDDLELRIGGPDG